MFAKRLFPALFAPSIFSNLRGDLIGALSATLVGVPQSMAYGLIAASTLGPAWAGAGALAGLFGSVIAGVLSIVLGSNPVTIVGPRAGTLLVFAALIGSFLGVPGLSSVDAVAFGCIAVAAAGLIQLCLGLGRLGRLAEFIPYPVIAGFTNGSALMIMASQIRPLLGVATTGDLADFQPGAAVLGAATIVLILLSRRVAPRVPPMLLGLGAGTLLYHLAPALGIDAPFGGTLPPLPDHVRLGLVGPAALVDALQRLPTSALPLMASSTLSMAALAVLDTALTTLAIDQFTAHRSDLNRELAAQGAANGVAGLLGLLPCAGSMARTAPLVQAGGRTALAGLLSAAMMTAMALLLAPAVQFLPRTVMAASLAAVGIGLVDKWTLDILRRWRSGGMARLPRADLLAMGAVVATTLAFGLMIAVGVGMALSLLFFLIRMSRSPVRRHYPATALTLHVQDDARRLAFLQRHGQEITIIELTGVLFFGSIVSVRKHIEGLMTQGVRHIILDLKRVRDLDATAARALERLNDDLSRAGGRMVLAYLHPERRWRADRRHDGQDRRQHPGERHLWRVLHQVGSLQKFAEDQIAPDLDGAIRAFERHMEAAPDLDTALPPATILRGIDRESVRRLRPYLSRRRFSTGDQVFRQGDPPDSIYFVASGRVDVIIDLPRTDRKLRVRTLTRGAIFGEMAILDPQPRSASVAASEPSICYRLSAEDFRRLKQSESDLALLLLENTGLIFVERLRASNLMIAELES